MLVAVVVAVGIFGFEAEDNLADTVGNAVVLEEVEQIAVAEVPGVLGIGFLVGEEKLDEVLSLESVMRLFGHWASLGSLDFPFRTAAEDSYAPVLVDVGAVTSTRCGSRVHWAHTVVPVVVALAAAVVVAAAAAS